MYRTWTAEIVGTNTHETYEHSDPDCCRDWLHDEIHEAYYHEEGPDAMAAFLAKQELQAHDFDVWGDFNCEIGDNIVRICADLHDDDYHPRC